jgi:two-component system cell cycle sensor histidine kinase/response regulator CckA
MRAKGFEQRASGRRLLVIEDDADIRGALDGLLSMEGFHVAGCSNGREALDWLRASPKPDVILLDLMMPVMDGWQFRVAQKADPEFANIPVLALSADATAKAAAIDADAYLRKPVDYDTLVDAIDRLLVDRQHRELQAHLAQTDRLASLGTLAAGIAHEINNPLAFVLLNLGFLHEELADILRDHHSDRVTDLRHALDHAREGAERIRDIVRGLRTFSRPENETVASLDVAHVLDSTFAMVANEVRHRGRLVKDYTETPKIVANEARLVQIFLNLLLNAVQALPEGRIDKNEIRLVVRPLSLGSSEALGGQSESRPDLESADHVVVEIHDNGIGIAPHVRARIFEPFFTTKPVGIGTGLGLAICHGIVTGLGGSLTVDSEVGVGSVFRLQLPIAPPVALKVAQTVDRTSPPPPVRKSARGRILVVDDEPGVCSSLERLLAGEGDVVAMTSAREALARISGGEHFDVILCDLMMPEMDAPALHSELLLLAPEQAERMVFVTGCAFTARARDFLDQISNERLSKPFDISALIAVVRKHIANETCPR